VNDLGSHDQAALDDLVAAYASAVDRRDWERLATVFTEDAVLLTPDPPRSSEPVLEAVGRAAIVATVRQVEAFVSTEHLVTASEWTGTAEEAVGRTTGEAHHRVEGPQPHSWVWHVSYLDDCVRTDEGWRIARRALTVDQIEKRRAG
jgi:ketosteroid isomerase-like protein